MEYKILANEDAIKKILSKGVKNMPQNPAACGYKPDQIRKFYYETEELTLELMKAIEENIYKNIVNYAAFEHPKTYIGRNYPNIEGDKDSKIWTITFPQYTGWTWKDRSIQLQEEITIPLSEIEVAEKRLAYAYVFFKGSATDTNEYSWVTYVTSPDSFIVVAQSAIPSLDLTQYRFICVAKLPIYKDDKYSSIPSLDMGGLPFRWNGEIVENIEVNDRIDELEKKIANGSGSNITKILNTTPVYGSIKQFARDLYNNGQFYIMVPFHTTESISDIPNWATGYAMGYIYIAYSQIWIEITERATNKVYRCNWVHHETITSDTDLSTIVGEWSDWEVCCKDIAVDTKLSAESENPVQNKVVAKALDRKLDIVDNTTTTKRVYGTDSGKQTTYTVDPWGATANTIPFRDGNGCVKVATPKADYDATNKTYVDILLESKVGFEDYASNNKAGVVKVSTGLAYGLEMMSSEYNPAADGCIAIKIPTPATVSSRVTLSRNREAVTLGWVDKVVKDVLINPQGITMTEEEQAKAREFLGIKQQQPYKQRVVYQDTQDNYLEFNAYSNQSEPFTCVVGKGIRFSDGSNDISGITKEQFDVHYTPFVANFVNGQINPAIEFVKDADGYFYVTKVGEIDLTIATLLTVTTVTEV